MAQTPLADVFLTNHPAFAGRFAAFGLVNLEKQRGLKRRMQAALKTIQLAGLGPLPANHVHVRSEISFPSTPITNDAELIEDIDNTIFLSTNLYHVPGSCEQYLEILVQVLTATLAPNNDAAYQSAINQVETCKNQRLVHDDRHPLRPGDLGHPTIIAFLDLLITELQATRATLVGNNIHQKQVTLYQYVTQLGENTLATMPPPAVGNLPNIVTMKSGKVVYDIQVEDEGARNILMTARPFIPGGAGGGDAAVVGYDGIKARRINALVTNFINVERPGRVPVEAHRRGLERTLVAATPGGRRTRRRAFKRRPKQSRKRMSRRA
jgi:hypothetical protein